MLYRMKYTDRRYRDRFAGSISELRAQLSYHDNYVGTYVAHRVVARDDGALSDEWPVYWMQGDAAKSDDPEIAVIALQNTPAG